MGDQLPAAAPFAGYGRPHYTRTPNLFFDDQMADLSRSELLTLLYIFRRSFGFQQDGAAISLHDFRAGHRATDGRPLDRGTGLGEHSLLGALQHLEARGFIFRHTQHDPVKGNKATYYELNIDGVPHCTGFCCACPPTGNADGEPSRNTDGEPSRNTDGEPTGNADGEPSRNTDGMLSVSERKKAQRKPTKERIPPPPTPAPRSFQAQTTDAVGVGGMLELESAQVRDDMARLIVFGLPEALARELARRAEQQGWDGAAIAAEIAYVTQAPGVRDPSAVLVASIRQNRRHGPLVTAEREDGARALDPAKYLQPGGKYAYLFNPTGRLALLEGGDS